MTDNKNLNFRKTALKPQGAFKPAKAKCVAGVGVVKPEPKPKKAGQK